MSARGNAVPADVPAGTEVARSDGVASVLAPRQAVTPEPLPAGERFYHPELDGLRFIAFAFVFMLHAWPHEVDAWTAIGAPEALADLLTRIVKTGRFGVDLFFTLSSYLITELLIREWRKRGRLDVRAFYIRRALRIWPLYFAFIALTVLVAPRLIADEYLPPVHVAAFLLFSGNWSIALTGFPNSVASPLWSVSIEEQFYILWPLLLSRLGVHRIVRFGLVMIAIATISRLVLVAMRASDHVHWTVTLTRLEPIALGAMLAVWLGGGSLRLRSQLRPLLFVAGLALWLVGMQLNRGGPGNLILYPLVAAGAAAMLLSALRDDARGALLASPIMTYLGRISYGAYVFHSLALTLAKQELGQPDGGLRTFLLVPLAGLALTIALAALSYRFLESPFLHLKRRFTHVRSRD